MRSAKKNKNSLHFFLTKSWTSIIIKLGQARRMREMKEMKEILEQITLIKECLEQNMVLEQKLKEYEMLEQKVGMPLTEFVDLHYVELKEENLSGEIVSQEVIDEIKTYFRISNHAIERLEHRTNVVVRFENGMMNFNETIRNIKYRINHRVLAYYNTDGSINIAIDKYNYFVFVKDDNGIWVLITFKEKSYNDNNIFYKQRLAKMGIERG